MTADQALAFVRLSAKNFGPLNSYDWGLMRGLGVVNERGEIDGKRYAELFDEQFCHPSTNS